MRACVRQAVAVRKTRGQIVTFFFGHVFLFGVVELRFILFEERHLDVVD